MFFDQAIQCRIAAMNHLRQLPALITVMAWIDTVSPEDAEGPIARQYKAAVGRAGTVAGIVQLHSNHAPTLRASMNLYFATTTAEDNPLSRQTRELIATVVSRTNDCFY